MIISIAEYAKMHGKEPATIRQGCLAGRFKTAHKIGHQWVIDSAEPLVDNRKKLKAEG